MYNTASSRIKYHQNTGTDCTKQIGTSQRQILTSRLAIINNLYIFYNNNVYLHLFVSYAMIPLNKKKLKMILYDEYNVFLNTYS